MTIQQLEMINYLNQAFYLDKKNKALIAEKKQNVSLAQRCTANYEMQKGYSPSKTNNQENILHKILAQGEEIERQFKEIIEIREEITDLINAVDDADQNTILRMRYLGYLTMAEIAETMNYEIRTVQRKHKQAVSNLVEKKIPNVIACHPLTVL